MRIRRLVKSKRGIDTIIATLLMVIIVVIAAVMVFTYATGLMGALLTAPKTSTESISMEYASFSNNNKTVSLFVRNTGSTPITLNGYYVKDASGNQYGRSSWAGAPTFAPTTLANATAGLSILISSACGPSCTTTGTAFTFLPGNAYSVILVTARNAQFSFTVVR